MVRTLLALLSGVFFSLSLATTANAAQPLRLIANTSPPYVDQQLPEGGLTVELLGHLFKRAGYAPDFTIDSWSRALEGVELGLYDALASAWYTEERAQRFQFSEPFLESELVLLKARADRGDYFELQHLAGKRLGVRVDYAYGVDFDAIPNLTLVRENHLVQNLLNLLNGKVDFVIGDQRTVVMQMHKYLSDRSQKFEVLDIELPVRQRHVAASRDIAGGAAMIEAFNKALADARQDGSYDAIVSKWDALYGIDKLPAP